MKTINESINNESGLFYEDTSWVANPLPSAKGAENPPQCRGILVGSPGEVDNRSHTLGPCFEAGVMGSGGVTDSYPLFALPGESFEKRNDRVLSHLELKEGLNHGSGSKRRNANRGGHPATHSNLYTVLEGVDMDGCTKSAWLKKKAITLVRWYRQLGLPYERDLPDTLECGSLRKSVRQCFATVSEQWELSFKTIQKVERNCCLNCEPRFLQLLDEWKCQRFQPVTVSDGHLRKFRDMLRRNIDKGWDQQRRPFIPNGNATESFKRREGGNWNLEEFSDSCRVELVFSSGKPRVVTLYSAENTRILGPLHYSLYSSLQRKGWLLVGDPTEKDIRKLTGTRYLSFDYQSATDNIKTAYVGAAVDVLIDQASNLTEDEIRALRVLSELKIEEDGRVATRGQPMGSVMSFPLLCLINKTVVDLALTELLLRKEISFREWSSHPCLVNGDDLLLREPRTGTNLHEEICRQGSEVGLVVNREKSMVDDQKAEVNSRLFQSGCEVKKLNVSVLWMKPEVNDVLGIAAEASVDRKSFVKIVRANAHILSKQQDKMLYRLPGSLQKACRQDKKIRRAITALPTSRRPVEEGVIRMVATPDGYDLSREEEYKAMVEEIDRVREKAIAKASIRKPRFWSSFEPARQSYSAATRRTVTTERELIPLCYARRFHEKQWDGLNCQPVAGLTMFTPHDGNVVNHLVDIIRTMKLFVAEPHPGTNEPLGSFVSVAV